MTLEAQDGTLGLSSLKQFWGMVRMLSINAMHPVKLENIHEPWATSFFGKIQTWSQTSVFQTHKTC